MHLRNPSFDSAHDTGYCYLLMRTGGCPHAAIREDISANLHALEELQAEYNCEMLFVESGGDNLSAQYSSELADMTLYVIDVAGGDKSVANLLCLPTS